MKEKRKTYLRILDHPAMGLQSSKKLDIVDLTQKEMKSEIRDLKYGQVGVIIRYFELKEVKRKDG